MDCASGKTPDRLTRPQVGLSPVTPFIVDGNRIEPSVSVPREPKQRHAAVATPEPLEETPVQCAELHGLTGGSIEGWCCPYAPSVISTRSKWQGSSGTMPSLSLGSARCSNIATPRHTAASNGRSGSTFAGPLVGAVRSKYPDKQTFTRPANDGEFVPLTEVGTFYFSSQTCSKR